MTYRLCIAVRMWAVKAHGFEGIVAKRLDSRYEPGQRSGAWRKMRINQGQDFVFGGYTPSGRNFDALIFGYYEGDKLLYAARTRNGFTPATRALLYRRFQAPEVPECPFANLPERHGGRWGQGLTAEKMLECRWLLCRTRHTTTMSNAGLCRMHFQPPHFGNGLLAMRASLVLILMRHSPWG